MTLLAGIVCAASLLWQACSSEASLVDRVEVVGSFPHDRHAFCQGLVFFHGALYEGTGRYGESRLRKVELETGKVLQECRLSSSYFGEGIAILNGKIYQLTWKAGRGFIYNLETFKQTGSFRYAGEGWGLTHDGKRLIMSDGTAVLRFVDPTQMEDGHFKVVRRVTVRSQGVPVRELNELEYVKGQIYANIWETDSIVRIDPATGEVLGWMNLIGLLPPEQRTGSEDVLNGIAYDAEHDRLFVTGKLWPRLFEIRLKS